MRLFFFGEYELQVTNTAGIWLRGKRMKNLLTGLSLTGLLVMCLVSTASAVIVPLESRLGGLAYYDPNLDITWATDADLNGRANWAAQSAWVAGLTIGGVAGWRLPDMNVNGDGTIVDCTGGGVSGCADNELGFLYWEEGITESAPGPFSNLVSDYWSGTEAVSKPTTHAWLFNMFGGNQNSINKTNGRGSWAVFDGDVGVVVPLPASAWLFGSALVLFGWMRSRAA